MLMVIVEADKSQNWSWGDVFAQIELGVDIAPLGAKWQNIIGLPFVHPFKIYFETNPRWPWNGKLKVVYLGTP